MKLHDVKKNPCFKCSYKLGLIHTITNPCPQCKLSNYKSYEWFQKQLEKKEAE